MEPEARDSLDQRKDLVEQRALTLADSAVGAKSAWLRRLGEPPTDRRDRRTWMGSVETVATYRDRYGVEGDTSLGPQTSNEAQQADRARASTAAKRATSITSRVTRTELDRGAFVEKPVDLTLGFTQPLRRQFSTVCVVPSSSADGPR